MIYSQKHQDEIKKFLSIFEIVPTFEKNEIKYLSKPNIIYQKTQDKELEEQFKKILVSGECFVSSNGDNEKIIIIYQGDLCIKVVTLDNKYYEYRYQETIYRPDKEDSMRDTTCTLTIGKNTYKIIKFNYESIGEYIFNIYNYNNIELARGGISGIEFNSKEYSEEEISQFSKELIETLEYYYDYTEEESKISLKHILIHLSNAYKDVKDNPEKYQKRLDDIENDIIVDFQDQIEQAYEIRSKREHKLIKQRKYLKERFQGGNNNE